MSIDTTLSLFQLRAGMRYTRYSCSPMRARLALDKYVQAYDPAHALQQAALCLHRDLEALLAQVNCINVDQVRLEIDALERLDEPHAAIVASDNVWNAVLFAREQKVPPHIILVDRSASR